MFQKRTKSRVAFFILLGLLSWANASQSIIALPSNPILVSPTDGATAISISPTLEVSVSDPEGDPMTVSFYGRPVSSATGEDFTIIAIPDTQHYTDVAANEANFAAQTQWIVNNKDSRNIVFVTGLGDIIQNGNVDSEWQIADAAYSLMEDPVTTSLIDGIPYGLSVGNHDQFPFGDSTGASTAKFNEYFGVSRFNGRNYYGGHYGTNNDNSYQLFSGGGMDFIAIHFEYDTSPDTAVLDWADVLLTTHSTRRAMISTHHMIGGGNPASWSSQGQAIYNALSYHESLFLMLGGHVPGEGRRQDTAVNNNVVNTLLSDYQSYPNGGNGFLRIMTFSPTNDTISVETYSPVLDQFETDDSSQFTLAYDMDDVAPFQLIGTNTNVPSGSNTSVSWPNLDGLTEYEWYVTAADGNDPLATSATWSFTTLDPPPATVPPDTIITATPANPSGNDSPTFEFTGTDNLTDPASLTFECQIDSGGFSACTSPQNYSSLADGSHTFDVRATDGDANTDPTPATFTWTIDTTLPIVATFQQDVAGYVGTEDTYLRGNDPDLAQGNNTELRWDTDESQKAGQPLSNQPAYALLRFNNIFGSGANQIPVGATIVSAELEYYVEDAGNFSNINEAITVWDEAATFNGFAGDPTSQGTFIGTATASSASTSFTADVTASITAWAAAPATNNGWLLSPSGSNGAQVTSSEGATIANRPKLTVEYHHPTTDPTIIIGGVPLSSFSSNPGSPSTEQSYSVSGINLTADIEITAPTDFEISTSSGSGFGSSLTLPQSGGSVATTTIYVRFERATAGTTNGDISHSSSGATTQNVAVGGTATAMASFQDGVDGYTGTQDTYIYDVSPSTVRGSEVTMIQDKNASDDRTSLLYFDLSSIPAGTVVSTAELQFYVNTEGQGFDMHRMLTMWDEATVTYTSIGNRHFAADDNDAASAVDANWPGDDGYTGFITISVPAATIQAWLDGTLTNNGWLMIATHASDGQQLRTKEHATVAHRPKLTVTFDPPVAPTVTISPSQLTRSNETPKCIYNLLHSSHPYASFSILQADIDTTPIDISGSIGGAPDYYFVEDDCGSGGTAVSDTVGEFSFNIVPGS